MKSLFIIVGFALVIASFSCHNAVRFTEAVFHSSAATTKLHLPQPWLDESVEQLLNWARELYQ